MRSAPATAWSLWVSSDLLLGYAWHGMAGGVHPGQSPACSAPVQSTLLLVARSLGGCLQPYQQIETFCIQLLPAGCLIKEQGLSQYACMWVLTGLAHHCFCAQTLSSHGCCLQTSLLPGAMAASALTQSCARSQWTLTCRSKSSLSRSVMADALLCWLTEFTTPLLLLSHMVQASAR